MISTKCSLQLPHFIAIILFITNPFDKFGLKAQQNKSLKQESAEKDYFSGIGDDKDAGKIHPSYNISFLHKTNFNPKVGGIDFLPNGKMLICTWDSIGAVYELSGIETGDTNKITIRRIASGLCEPLGIKVVKKRIFVMQRPELTELIDLDNDGLIDEYKTVCDKWGFSGNYHEFAFGPVFKDGFFYATLSTPRRTRNPPHHDRGKVIQIDTNGNFEIFAHGFRTPNGIGIGVDEQLFVNDNEGEWLPSSKLLHLKRNAFYGHRGIDFEETIGLVAEKPVVWMPQGEVSNSPGQPIMMNDGAYKGQMIHGDVTHGGIKRVFIEKIDSVYQGCIFNFSQGFEGGINRMCWGPDGGLYVGAIGSVGNWGQENKNRYGLQKIKFNEKITFEMLAVRIKPTGFEIEFTEPVDTNQKISFKDFQIKQWRYIPTEAYGGPKVDEETLQVVSAGLLEKGKKVFLQIKEMKSDHVLHIKINRDLRSRTNQHLWTSETWYTLNSIPGGKNGTVNKTHGPRKSIVSKSKKLGKQEIASLGPKLIGKSGCLQCHAVNEKIIGPSFIQIAQRYKNTPSAVAKLVKKVKNGGSGVWGDEPMSPQTHISTEQITLLINYVLSL